MEMRNVEPVVGGEQLAHPLDVRRLLPEVELAPERLRKVLHERRYVDRLPQRLALERLLGKDLEEPEVSQDLLLRAWPLHLDDDAPAVLERGAVHLADRSGRERLGFDRREQVLPRDAQFLLHDLNYLGFSERLDVVLQLLELRDQLR